MNNWLLLILNLSCLLAAVPTAQSSSGPLPAVQVFIDGKPVDSTSGKIEIPASHNTVSFGLGKPAEAFGDEARRMRFRLEGIDNDWRQIASEMGLTVSFTDSAGDQVGQHIFRVLQQNLWAKFSDIRWPRSPLPPKASPFLGG